MKSHVSHPAGRRVRQHRRHEIQTFGYPGSKGRVVNQLASLMPTSRVRIDLYYGSGRATLPLRPAPVEIANDLDGEVINYFRVVQTYPTVLFDVLRSFVVSEGFFQEINAIDPETLTPAQRAARFLYLSEAGYCGRYREKKYLALPKSAPLRYQPRKMYPRLMALHRRIQNITFVQQDFERVINRFDGPNTFFFVDPPYDGREDYYRVQFAVEDHLRLSERLRRIKGKALVTLPDLPEVRARYGYASFVEPLQMRYSLANGKRPPVTELAIGIGYDRPTLPEAE